MAPRGAVLLAALTVASSFPIADLVANLPGYGPPPSVHYSGYLNASNVEPGTFLHYWFAAAEIPNWQSAPVVLWLNGGPGSSSILGLLQEQGPLLINQRGGLTRNPYSWTREVNLIALESPAGVGYSYCAAMQTGGSCSNTDKSTAAAARAAMQDFFATKFPELAANRFYITGESYAGVYVPTLAREILDHAPEVNLKGVGVGDPCTDNDSQRLYFDMLWYGHKAGFIPDKQFDFLWNTCNLRVPHPMTSGQWNGKALKLKAQGVEPTPECLSAYRLYLTQTSKAFSQDWPLAFINDVTLYGPAAVVGSDQEGSLNWFMAQWMMRADVRKALHVENAPQKTWPGPDPKWQYTSDYNACNDHAPADAPSMIDFYRYIAPKLEVTIVFNGDTDPCVTYEGTRIAMERVGFNEIPGGHYRPWFVNITAATLGFLQEKPLLFGPDLAYTAADVQFGGHVVNYDNRLSFVTVHGSGHMVPQFRPHAGLLLLKKLVRSAPWAPLQATREQLGQMSDGTFDSYLDMWIKNAQESWYVN